MYTSFPHSFMAILYFSLLLVLASLGVDAAVFTLQNRCQTTIWPAIQPNGGQPVLVDGGLELRPTESKNVTTPERWAGRFWARSGCTFDSNGEGSCTTGDCGSGLYCRGLGGEPPATLAEFTLDSPLDFYDVSLVDGYNMPISIFPYESEGVCSSVRCDTDLNLHCPANLIVRGENGETVACKSACTAYHTPEYCCTGEFQNPNTCQPTQYSQYFKQGCPTSYSYAFDDQTSTFTCRNSDYLIIFC